MFKDTRLPVATVIENLEDLSVDEVMEQFDVTREQISAVLDFYKYVFLNCDLTINLARRPVGEWICLQSRTLLGGNGCGMAESALSDEQGLIGRATQSLAVRRR